MRFRPAIVTAVGSSLKLKLVLLVVLILGLTVGVAPWGAIETQEHQLMLGSEEHLQILQEVLKTLVANMQAGNHHPIQNLLEAIGAHGDIKTVRIFDTDGVVHFSSHPAEVGTRLSASEMRRYQGLADPVIVTREGGDVTQAVLQPLFNSPACFKCHPAEHKVVGMLQLSVSLRELHQEVAGLRRSAFAATLLSLGVVVLGVWLALTLLVDHPLQRLVAVMGQAERGDLSVRADVPNSDELGQLARHFNDMVTKLQAAQAELERYHQEQLARADRLATIGEMAAAIAHEIRNPLTGISGALSVLSRDFSADDSRREIVRQTRLLIERLNNTVEDILHYSRPSSPQFQTVKLDDIVDRSLSLAEGEARKAGIEIIRAPASDANGAVAAMVSADPHQIQQVLLNLILNAIQASAAGAQIAVRTHTSADDGEPARAVVEVEDHGKGMTPEEAAQAFQPFFSTKAHGTGLGLPIARQIVEQHHGRLSLRSTPGVGTCVQVELPARVQAAAERMGELIEGLLGLARLARHEVHRESVDLSALAAAVPPAS
jgi:signal transduction histidine kinase